MEKVKMFGIGFIFFFLTTVMLISGAWAFWEGGKIPHYTEWLKQKDIIDNPAPFLKQAGDPKNYLPSEFYHKVTYEVEAMKSAWAEALGGIRSPVEVGKIAPKLKPGTYSYLDKDKYPFKDLMVPNHYSRFKPGGPPHMGNYSEVKVVPTRQYYWYLPLVETTRMNEGKTMLDDQGYLVASSYQAGIPFPKPSGKFKAQQIIYNWYKRYTDGETNVQTGRYIGVNRRCAQDWSSFWDCWNIKLSGRTQLEPIGWFDERAKRRHEDRTLFCVQNTPQDSSGNAMSFIYYDDPAVPDQPLIYLNQIRRLRKLSAEDTQDSFPGVDAAYDDEHGLAQKLSPNRFPYKYELIAEREYLFPTYQWDGAMYLDSKNCFELRNLEWERRPVYVLQLTQLDPSYLYSKRVIYIDKETFLILYSEFFDQKGRLYRSYDQFWAFLPDQGMFWWYMAMVQDHVDLHSSSAPLWIHP